MLKVAFVGWRGMVGSVLMERMRAEDDFRESSRCSSPRPTSAESPPTWASPSPRSPTRRTSRPSSASTSIVTCQGGDYTREVYAPLRAAGYKGYWIDAASALRMDDDCVIVLDPVNRAVVEKGLADGIRTFAGGNCTVSLMLMGLAGLFRHDLVEWMTSMTYQSASGAGAKNMIELVAQMADLADAGRPGLQDPAATALDLDRAVTGRLQSGPGAGRAVSVRPWPRSLLAWIDRPMDNGQTREEWKGFCETNKILGTKSPSPSTGSASGSAPCAVTARP